MGTPRAAMKSSVDGSRPFGHAEDQHWQGATVPYAKDTEEWVLPGGKRTASRIRALEMAKRISQVMAAATVQKLAA